MDVNFVIIDIGRKNKRCKHLTRRSKYDILMLCKEKCNLMKCSVCNKNIDEIDCACKMCTLCGEMLKTEQIKSILNNKEREKDETKS